MAAKDVTELSTIDALREMFQIVPFPFLWSCWDSVLKLELD